MNSNRSFTPIFDINKPFPKAYANKNKILVKFQSPYAIYLQSSLEYKFLLLETEFLARFKRVMYDGRVAPMSEMAVLKVPPDILTCIDVKTRAFSLINFQEEVEYFVQGRDLEYLNYIPLSENWIEDNLPYVINPNVFIKDFIEYYKLDNIYNSKLMKIYNSSGYFESITNAANDKSDLGSFDEPEINFNSQIME